MLIITRSAVDDDAVAITVASAAVGGDGVAEQMQMCDIDLGSNV